jgi:hypothetical protein
MDSPTVMCHGERSSERKWTSAVWGRLAERMNDGERRKGRKRGK